MRSVVGQSESLPCCRHISTSAVSSFTLIHDFTLPNSTHIYLGRAYEAKGMYENAVRELNEAIELSGARSVKILIRASIHAARAS